MLRRASCATRQSRPAYVNSSLRWFRAADGRSKTPSNRRFWAATATANFCWGRGVTEHLRVSGIGHRGDGIVETPQGRLYIPHALPGETVEVKAVPGHPDRRQLVALKDSSADRIAPIC